MAKARTEDDESLRELVTIDPKSELRFFLQPDKHMKAYLTIENITSTNNVAFKIKTT
eukprot:CAMPEP_0170556094 /NCGR_PEP_ID=MMETSP0211-20121228/15671_1 /TAXON_ID=311385 /ORGANISM="Pseudokeronopsis sp., Strain OXSARD2" /LENGTH=56 /DNA_ID=CAMNT_0010866229 /DNA_START=6 /DNA_END=176 /DNA_ORIENTATION=+